MNLLTPSFIKAGYTATQDAKAALRFLSKHALDLNIDPNNVFIMGISAGSVTSLNAVFLEDDDPILGRNRKLDRMYGCLDCVGETYHGEYRIKGVINIGGGVYDTDIFLNNPDIPVLNVHGEDDNVVPIDCGLPFLESSSLYNETIGQLTRLARTMNLEKVAEELESAEIEEICGSDVIHRDLRFQNKSSGIMRISSADHYLVMSTNNVLTTTGESIVERISEFLYDQYRI